MGLFTLVACSEDAYQEADKMNESGTVENGSGGNIIPMTVGPYYNSPFEPYGTGISLGTKTTFTNNTPLLVELKALAAEHDYNNEPTSGYQLFESSEILMKPFSNEINQDMNAPMAINIPAANPVGNPAMSYDFGNYSQNWRFHHYGKVHCFKYIIRSEKGILAEGYIKQRFFDDTFNYKHIETLADEWVYFKHCNIPGFDLVFMKNTISNEVCLTNDFNYTNPYMSSYITVTDPSTGTVHKLDFYTDALGVYVTLN